MTQATSSPSKSKRAWPVYVLAFLVPFLLMVAVFMSLKVTPFGPKSPLFSDLGSQYIPIFEHLRTAVHTDSLHPYSFNLGLGSNFIPLMAYYLLSPINVLVLFSSTAGLPTMVIWMLMIKIGLIGLTMSLFLNHFTQKTDWSLVLFSTAYALSGFVVMYFYDIMWLDALAWLPLVALGIHRLVARHHIGLYMLALTATIVSNYYLGYMTCLFAIIYVIYVIVEAQPEATPVVTVLRHHWSSIWRFLVASLLAGGMAMVVLIPTGLGMLLTGKTALERSAFYPSFRFGPEMLSQFGIGASNYTSHLYHAPSVFMGGLMFLLVIVFFVSPRIKAVEKTRAAWMLTVLILSMMITLFNTIWHMMQQPEGFPFRNVFFFTFFAITLAYRAWQTQPAVTMNDPQKVLALVWAVGLLATGYLTQHLYPALWRHFSPSSDVTTYIQSQPALHWLWLGTAILVIDTTLLFISERSGLRITALAIILFAELGVNFHLGTTGIAWGSQPKFAAIVRKQNQTLDQVDHDASNHPFYRIDYYHSKLQEAFTEPYNDYNDPLLFNYRGVSSYSSTLEEHARVLQHDLGYYSQNVRRISAQGYSYLNNTLFAVRYRINDYLSGQPVTTLDSYAGMGFAVPNQLVSLQLTDQNALGNQQAILRALGAPAGTLTPISTTATSRIATDAQIKTASNIPNHRPLYWQTRQITMPTSGVLHGFSPSDSVIYSSLKINGQKSKPRINADGRRYLMNLGYYSQGEKLTIQYVSTKPAKTDVLQLAAFNKQRYYQLVDQLKQHRFSPSLKTNDTHVAGTVAATAKQRTLFLSIPDSPGWHATVNGRSVPIKSVMHASSIVPVKANYPGFIGVPLQPGTNKVVLNYVTPGLKVGKIISLLSFFLALLFWFLSEFGLPGPKNPRRQQQYQPRH